MANKTIKVVTREIDGSLKTKEYDSFDALNSFTSKSVSTIAAPICRCAGCPFFVVSSDRFRKVGR